MAANIFEVFSTFPDPQAEVYKNVADRLNGYLAENPHLRVVRALSIQVQKIGGPETQLLVEFEEK